MIVYINIHETCVIYTGMKKKKQNEKKLNYISLAIIFCFPQTDNKNEFLSFFETYVVFVTVQITSWSKISSAILT